MNGERRLTGRPSSPRPPVFSATSAACSMASWIGSSPAPRFALASSSWVRTSSCARISADSGAWRVLLTRRRLPAVGLFKPLGGLAHGYGYLGRVRQRLVEHAVPLGELDQ